MFDVGGGELILIFIVVLLLFGPKKIPEVMRSVGKGLRQFRQAQEDLKTQLRDISSDIERSTEVRTVQPTINFTPPVEVEDENYRLQTTNYQTEDSLQNNPEATVRSSDSTSEAGAILPEESEEFIKPIPRPRRVITENSAADIENMENTDPKLS